MKTGKYFAVKKPSYVFENSLHTSYVNENNFGIASMLKRSINFVTIFFYFTVRIYFKLEINIKISSFKYFRTVKQKTKQICSFIFWENLWRTNLLSVLSDLYLNIILLRFDDTKYVMPNMAFPENLNFSWTLIMN